MVSFIGQAPFIRTFRFGPLTCLLRPPHKTVLHVARVEVESRDRFSVVDARGEGGCCARQVERGYPTRGITIETVNLSVRIHPVSRDHSGLVDARGGGTDRTRRVELSDRTRSGAYETVNSTIAAVESRDHSSPTLPHPTFAQRAGLAIRLF